MVDRRRAWAIFGVMSLMYCFSQFYRVSTALIAVDLAAEFGLGPDELALLGGMFFYAFALAQFPLGPALDRWGARTIVVGAASLCALGSALFALTDSWGGLLAGRALMGLGMAPVLMGSLKLLAEWFPAGAFGTVSGLILSLGTVGALLAATPLAGLVAWLGWRGTFLAFAALTLLAAAAIHRTVKERPDGAAPAPIPREGRGGLRHVLGLPSFWLTAPLALVGYASVASLQGLWAGPYFMESLSYTRTEAGNILLALGLATAVGSSVGGWLSDRIRSRKWVVTGGNAVSILCFIPLVGIGTPSSAAGWTAVFAVLGFFSAFRVLLYAHVKESVPPHLVGTAVTAINFFIMVGPALVQQVMGTILEGSPGNYEAAFLFPLLTLAVGSGLYLLTREARPGRTT
ncbi:MAG: MFS transporter [Deferrisomatales bacterium]|nr:MFS transporter [Deferrisomatales bacterium]